MGLWFCSAFQPPREMRLVPAVNGVKHCPSMGLSGIRPFAAIRPLQGISPARAYFQVCVPSGGSTGRPGPRFHRKLRAGGIKRPRSDPPPAAHRPPSQSSRPEVSKHPAPRSRHPAPGLAAVAPQPCIWIDFPKPLAREHPAASSPCRSFYVGSTPCPRGFYVVST